LWDSKAYKTANNFQNIVFNAFTLFTDIRKIKYGLISGRMYKKSKKETILYKNIPGTWKNMCLGKYGKNISMSQVLYTK
jgi:hypothetical protein